MGQALFAVVMEAYLHGVSTRKVDDLVKALRADTGISKSDVSRICADLDVEVGAFRDRTAVVAQSTSTTKKVPTSDIPALRARQPPQKITRYRPQHHRQGVDPLLRRVDGCRRPSEVNVRISVPPAPSSWWQHIAQ